MLPDFCANNVDGCISNQRVGVVTKVPGVLINLLYRRIGISHMSDMRGER